MASPSKKKTSLGRRKAKRTAGAALPRDEHQASIHRRTRQAHSQEIAEDYVEVVADLIATEGEARAIDIARRMGVTHVTVTKTVARLQRAGLMTSRPYRSIFLTEKGREMATEARRRHEVVIRFLKAVGVSEENALSDAEGIEHHVSAETLATFERFARSMKARS